MSGRRCVTRSTVTVVGDPLAPPTRLLATPYGVELEYLVTGAGDPITVFAHGLGNGIAETRPLGSGVGGRKVFFQFRGHGRSSAPPGRWTFADLARDLGAVSDAAMATRAVGASLGAGALCRLLVDDPDRFERVVMFLPALLDTPRPTASRGRLMRMLSAIESHDESTLAAMLADQIPPGERETAAARAYIRRRVVELVHGAVAPGLASLSDEVPVDDRRRLAVVTADVLVIGGRADELHPVEVAEQLADVLPKATLYIYNEPGVVWTQRADLRNRIAGFLNAA